MIHKYKLNGNNIVLDVNSGAVHILDDCSFDILENYKNKIEETLDKDIIKNLSDKYTEDEIIEANSELFELYQNGLIFSEDDYKNLSDIFKDSPIKSMCLNIAHDCNLACEYCFASKGDFGGQRILMPLEIGKKAIDFLINNSGSRRNLEVDFFGGEPLMNFGVVKEIVHYARSLEKKHNKNFRFTITTNGLSLDDDKIDFINQEMSNAVLSIDGRKHINDKLRVTNNNNGSYDLIVPKFQKLVSRRKDKDYYVRGTFTKHNLDFSKDVIHLSELGFKHISVEPVVSDENLNYSIKKDDLPRVFEEYATLASEIINRNDKDNKFNFFHFMIDLNQGPCAIKRIKGCGCGNEYIAVTPEGDIYPCHQFVGDEQWKMGNVKDNYINTEMKALFSKANIFNKSDCKNCWAKFYCSGGCTANSWKYKKNLMSSHDISCDLEKKRIECAIMILAMNNKNKEPALNK